MEIRYNEEAALTEYIWNNYSKLITHFEKIASESLKRYEDGSLSKGNSLSAIARCLTKSNTA